VKFLVSIISKDEKFAVPVLHMSDFREKHPDSAIELVKNNSEYLTVVNNRMIEKALKEGFDFLVTMHADVELDLNGLVQHIEECADKYDLMGLCGCEKISVGTSPLNWFVGSRKYPQYRWGCVCHGEIGNTVSFFSGMHPETTDHAVSCIDGLCMILSRKAMESGLRFDDKLRFNCYDTQLSLDAILKHNLRVGVLVERELRHYSIGKSIFTDAFLEDELVLRKRFGFDIPKGSKIENFLNRRAAAAV